MAKPVKVRDLTTFRDGDVLDVPGHPRPIQLPGHTLGMSGFLLESSGTLFVGDELCNGNPLTGRPGVQILSRCTNVSSGQAIDSLNKLERVEASTILFGHGDPWTAGMPEALARAREAGPS